MVGCCARAASGHETADAAAPPTSDMNARRLIRSPRRRGRAAASARSPANTASVDDGGFHLRLHSRARGVVDSLQPEHAVVLAAGQLLCGVLIARGPADAIKIHGGVTGTRDHVHAAAIALDRAAQA